MCGIVGAVLAKDVVPFLIEGLKSLEYRGYDSAGIAIYGNQKQILTERAVGQVHVLASAVEARAMASTCGIGHTRWATHGVPSKENSHPHCSAAGGISVAVVHNGIIENHDSLRAELQDHGYVFASQTDTEVAAHLIHFHLRQGLPLVTAVRATIQRLDGSFALGVIANGDPNTVVATKRNAPLLLGLAADGTYIASDASALVAHTRKHVYLQDDDVALITTEGCRVFDANGKLVHRQAQTSNLDAEAVSLGGYPHYMLKEIFEQPAALSRTLSTVLAQSAIDSRLWGPKAASLFDQVKHIRILACGTSFYAGSVAKNWFEEYAGIPCTVEIASEYRYRAVAPQPGTLALAISQSGETADTLAAVAKAQESGCLATLALCNVPESSLTRAADLVMLMQAGPEIGVASTKAFTTQLANLWVLALALAKQRGKLPAEQEQQHVKHLAALPEVAAAVLAQEETLKAWAKDLAEANSALFLGRGCAFPIAQEGALKLKEITYIHAEAYPAGELKHGPLALVDHRMPVIVMAANNDLVDKLLSNVEEVQARGGRIYGLTGAGVTLPGKARALVLPEVAEPLESVPQVIALQLLAYHTALHRGLPVDRPRNLAKSVTTE